jgi:hypothetical protein
MLDYQRVGRSSLTGNETSTGNQEPSKDASSKKIGTRKDNACLSRCYVQSTMGS